MKYLFIAHSADRSGAPLSLLEFIRAFQNIDLDFECTIVILKAGELEKEFSNYGRTVVISRNKRNNLYEKIRYRLVRSKYEALVKKKSFHIGLANSSSSWFFIKNFSFESFEHFFLRLPESTHSIKTILRGEFKALRDSLNHGHLKVVAPSNANANSLKECLDKGAKVQVIYGIAANKGKELSIGDSPKKLLELKEKGKVIIGGSGRLIWEKGVDYFLQVCALTVKKCPDAHFVWLGAMGDLNTEAKSPFEKRILYDLKKTSLQDSVIFLPKTSAPEKIYELFDILLMTSRWDSFPLVVLENALAKTPSICFKNCGGAEEFIANDCGVVVDYMDVQNMSDQVVSWVRNSNELNKIANNAYNKGLTFNQVYLQNQLKTILEEN